MASIHSTARRRAWIAGRLYPLHQLRDVEVLGHPHRCVVEVSGTTLHGTPAELEALAHRLLTVVRLHESPAAS